LSSLETRLGHLEDKTKVTKAFETDVIKTHQKILADNRELMKQNELLDSEVGELREEVHAQTEALLQIHDMMLKLKVDDRSDVAKVATKAEKAVRDNAWNVSLIYSQFAQLLTICNKSGTRITFMRLLGIVNSKQIKNVVPLGHGNHYLLNAETGNNVLRPNWSSSFTSNSDWHQDAINFIRTKGPHFHPALTKLALKSKTDDEILKRLAAIFKILARAYGKSADDPEVQAAKRIVRCTARRTQRKIKVSFSVVAQNAILTLEI
jgi:hypothetical protein